MFKVTPIATVLFFTTLVNLFVLVVSWQRKKVRSGLYFSLGMLAITGWTMAATFDYAAVPIPLKVFFSKLEYVCYNSALVFMALFAFSFAGYSQWLESKRGVGLLGFIALSNILLAWTNDWHGWLWAGFSVSQFDDNTVIFEPGPAHIWTTVTGYFIILLIVIPLWQATLSGPALSRRQARWLLLGTLVPVAANLVYILQSHEYTGVDWTSVTFSAVGLIFLVALYGTRLIDLSPIARDKLISNMSDGLIVLDLQHRIIDINQAAATMVETSARTLIGQSLVTIAPFAQSLLEGSTDRETKTEIEIGAAERRNFEVTFSPLSESQTSVIGFLLILHDITERKRAESEREAWAGLLQATFDSATAGILVLDPNGHTLLANKQVAKIWPLEAMQPVIDSDYPFLTAIEPFIKNHTEVVKYIESLSHHLADDGYFRLLLWDDRIFDVRIAPYYNGPTILGQVWTFENVTKRIQAEKADTLAEERRRISQEAHDGLLQGLVGLRLQLKHWHKILDQNPARLHTQIDELQTFVADSIDEMRRFIFALRPAPLDSGFFEAVRQLTIGMQRYYTLPVELNVVGSETRLHRDWEQTLFRVIQESLSNIGKHAQATRAAVEIDLTDSQNLTITIQDNGHGFNQSPAANPSPGFGLGNMSERIRSLGGQLTIDSQPGQGTAVRVSVPYNTFH